METKREVFNVWFYRVKTLPNRQPLFACSLCSMVCLWLVLITALILALNGMEFNLSQLIGPAFGTILVATILFARWKRLAQQIKEQERGIENYSSKAIEKIIVKLSLIASSFQWIGTMLFAIACAARGALVQYMDVQTYSIAVQGFCIFAFLFSFVLNRLHAYSRSRLEETRGLTEEEKIFLKHEYLGRFLFPHIFWIGAFAFFHWVM